MYLMYGHTNWVPSGFHIPVSIKERYISEMNMEYDNSRKKYKCDYENIWKYFTKKYGDELDKKKIRSFEQLKYHASI